MSAHKSAAKALFDYWESLTPFGTRYRPNQLPADAAGVRGRQFETATVIFGAQEHIGFGDGALDELSGIFQVDIYAPKAPHGAVPNIGLLLDPATLIHNAIYPKAHREKVIGTAPYLVEIRYAPEIVMNVPDDGFPGHDRAMVSLGWFVEVRPRS